MDTRTTWLAALLLGCSANTGDPEVPVDSSEQDSEVAVATWQETLRVHLEALEDAALEHEGHRALGSDGYAASMDYVVEVVERLGLEAELEAVDVTSYSLTGVSLQHSDVSLARDQDYTALDGSPSGIVSGTFQGVDITIPPDVQPNSSTSGCEMEDFASFASGQVAVLQRGSCTFEQKARNAEAAGATAVLIFNEGQQGRRGVVFGSLDRDTSLTIPVLGLSYEAGASLLELDPSSTLDVEVQSERAVTPSWNVLVDIPGDTGLRWVVGAHLDSVPAGPGINDNGTGVAALLVVAEHFAERNLAGTHGIRLGFWAAEEVGLIGSTRHAYDMDDATLESTLGNLNFDMIGSPNPVRFIYDGDGSDLSASVEIPSGSDDIEALFIEYFEGMGMDHAPTAFQGRTDYVGFSERGLPVGGTFTGASSRMSGDEADRFDGVAGAPYDPCYHQACDTVANVDFDTLEEMTLAAISVLERVSTTSGQSARRRMPTALPVHEESLMIGGCQDAHEVVVR